MRNQYFDEVLNEMQDVHDKKNADYASDEDPFSNFTGVASATGLSVDMVFFTMIGIKVMRLKELVGVGKDPNFESVDDTILDLANYAAIWKAFRARGNEPLDTIHMVVGPGNGYIQPGSMLPQKTGIYRIKVTNKTAWEEPSITEGEVEGLPI